jgi:hypothetical protein
MPHVLNDTDILDYPSAASTDDTLPARPLGLPTSTRGRAPFLPFLRHLFGPRPSRWTCRQEPCTPGAPRYETALDILAREYPDSHLRIMAVIG